jgi:membrane-associated phospholipid phosphatase
VSDRKTRIPSYLLAALWPAGQAAIAAATVYAVRRAARDGGSQPGRTRPARKQFASARIRFPDQDVLPELASDLVKLGVVTGAGGVLAYKVMELLGPAVVNHGPAIDAPIQRWTASHQVKLWTDVMERLTKTGNTWTTWGAAVTAAATLGVAWPQRKWVPPAALMAAVLVDKYATLALRHRFGRVGPPDSPLGTYPSGGVDRVVYLYGLIAYLLWREFSGSREGEAWAIGAVAALAFNEAYSREYLSKHWFSDILSGIFYGAILLVPTIAAVRLVAGPAVTAMPTRQG